MNTSPSIEAADSFNAAAARDGWPGLCDAALDFAAPDLKELLSTWLRFADADGIPTRSQISARVLKPYLSRVAIYERVPTNGGGRRYRARLVGSDAALVIGNLTGKFLDEAVPASFLPRWYTSLDVTLAARRPLRFLTRSDTNRMEFLVAEYFSAPMLDSNGAPNLVLGCGRYDGQRQWADIERDLRKGASAKSLSAV
jgi:hypothetical protein